jgi:L-rhamnose mutarotase
MPYACGPGKPLRLGQVIELRRECEAEYTRVHADDHAGVRALLAKHGLHNFSIFMTEAKGALLLFLYAEYTGEDYEADMAALAAEPQDVEWHKLCDPMQISLHATGGWKKMDCVFYNQ